MPKKTYDIIHVKKGDDFEFKISLDNNGNISEYCRSYYYDNEGGGDTTYGTYKPNNENYSFHLNNLYNRYIQELTETLMDKITKNIIDKVIQTSIIPEINKNKPMLTNNISQLIASVMNE